MGLVPQIYLFECDILNCTQHAGRRYFAGNILTFAQIIFVTVFFYNIFLFLYSAGIFVVSVFNEKAKQWKAGRKDIFKKMQASIGDTRPIIWMHCASLGEFEQGRPVLESLRKAYPNYKMLLTFFSPSGYEVRKNYNGADWVFYLPLDVPRNVARFLNIANPSLAIFVKYEYWYNYLNQVQKRKIPTILISAIFRKDKIFFKWYGGLHRKMLGCFNEIFVQDEKSRKLLEAILPKEKVTVAGDTRFDRVAEIASGFEPIDAIEKFVQGKNVLVAGSTWPDDEKNLNLILEKFENKISLIIAPHEISDNHINFLKRLFPQAILFSELVEASKNELNHIDKNVLIINNIGMLSKLYYYADITYIGGGFNSSGIHNTLEAAVYAKPVVFGPNYQKFSEAIGLIENKGGFSYSNENELIAIISELLRNASYRLISGEIAGKFVRNNAGATSAILNGLKQISF